MIERKVKLESIADVTEFNRICTAFDCDVDLTAGKYYVDAKSVLGIYSLDLSLPLTILVATEDEKLVDEKFAKYINN